ncbi:hypothetical protein BJV82DRAFT_610248 [Fennellomyces sp. T-0311]|nr:hypothetical protein BJV82DRAFT_610248 [Fennellomyces sp. T-0311]
MYRNGNHCQTWFYITIFGYNDKVWDAPSYSYTKRLLYCIGRFKKERFDSHVRERLTDLTNSIKKDDTISRLPSTIEILSPVLSRRAAESKLVKCIAKLLDALPRIPIAEDIYEFELCHRFLSPVFSALFDDPDRNVLFRWTSITNQEAKAEPQGQGVISRHRSDGMVSELDGAFFDRTLGFVEVKCSHEAKNKHAMAKDQVRLGVLSKNALDKYHSQSCLSVQVIGYTITFYIQSMEADGLYTMTELLHVQAPSSLQTLPQFMAHFDDLLAVLDCFNDFCLMDQSPGIGRKRPTLSDDHSNDISSRPKSCKRRSYTLQ